jgi:hypothetical protein
MQRVEEQLRLREASYCMKNELQETQLRYLSLKNIQQNQQGYLDKKSKERLQMEELYMRTQEYKLRLSDPSTCVE